MHHYVLNILVSWYCSVDSIEMSPVVGAMVTSSPSVHDLTVTYDYSTDHAPPISNPPSTDRFLALFPFTVSRLRTGGGALVPLSCMLGGGALVPLSCILGGGALVPLSYILGGGALVPLSYILGGGASVPLSYILGGGASVPGDPTGLGRVWSN